jgi:hypothetical protein
MAFSYPFQTAMLASHRVEPAMHQSCQLWVSFLGRKTSRTDRQLGSRQGKILAMCSTLFVDSSAGRHFSQRVDPSGLGIAKFSTMQAEMDKVDFRGPGSKG